MDLLQHNCINQKIIS